MLSTEMMTELRSPNEWIGNYNDTENFVPMFRVRNVSEFRGSHLRRQMELRALKIFLRVRRFCSSIGLFFSISWKFLKFGDDGKSSRERLRR